MERTIVVLNGIHVDIMDYISPAAWADVAFRTMWVEIECENKVAVNMVIRPIQDEKEFLNHVIKPTTNMKCLCSHLELLRDPDGAYCQLISLQEVNKESKTNTVKPEIRVEFDNHSRNSMPLQQYENSESSGNDRLSHLITLLQALVFKRSLEPHDNSVESPEEKYQMPITEKIQKDQKVSLHRLAKLNKPELHLLLFGVFVVMFTDMISTLYEPPSKLPKDSRFWVLMLVALGIVSLVASQARSYFFFVVGCKLIKRIRSMCFKKVVYMDISWFDEPEHSTGAGLSAYASILCTLVGDTLGFLVENIATLIISLGVAFEANWQLALIVVFLPLLGLNAWVQVKFIKGFGADAKMMYEEASQVPTDALCNTRIVASFCAEGKVFNLYRNKCNVLRKTGIRRSN